MPKNHLDNFSRGRSLQKQVSIEQARQAAASRQQSHQSDQRLTGASSGGILVSSGANGDKCQQSGDQHGGIVISREENGDQRHSGDWARPNSSARGIR